MGSSKYGGSNAAAGVLFQTGSKYKPTPGFDSGNGRGKKIDGNFGLFRIKDTLNSSNIIETYNLMYVPKNPHVPNTRSWILNSCDGAPLPHNNAVAAVV
jgi:hypothetical protein